MKLVSPFFWKRTRRFLIRLPRPQVYTFVILICFVILAIANASDIHRKNMKKIMPPSPTSTKITEKDWTNNLTNNLSVKEKASQLMIFGIKEAISSESASNWQNVSPGGFLITGNHTKEDIASISSSINNLNLLIAPFIAIDEEGGMVKRMTDDPNPGAYGLRSSTDKEICDVWENTNQLLASAGVTMNFGIIGDVGWKKDVYILPRTYSASPSAVAKFVTLSISCQKDVIPVLKHFPGHGRTIVDSHFSVPVITVTEDEWQKTDAIPFQAAIENHVPAIMVGHLLFNKIASEPASLSPIWQKKLRDMGFDGLSITDDLHMLTLSGFTLNQAVEKAFGAGNDLLLISTTTTDPDALINNLVLISSSSADMKTSVDERLGRILHAKYLLQTKDVQ